LRLAAAHPASWASIKIELELAPGSVEMIGLVEDDLAPCGRSGPRAMMSTASSNSARPIYQRRKHIGDDLAPYRRGSQAACPPPLRPLGAGIDHPMTGRHRSAACFSAAPAKRRRAAIAARNMRIHSNELQCMAWPADRGFAVELTPRIAILQGNSGRVYTRWQRISKPGRPESLRHLKRCHGSKAGYPAINPLSRQRALVISRAAGSKPARSTKTRLVNGFRAYRHRVSRMVRSGMLPRVLR